MKALPYTYLAKGKYWRFRHAKTGDVALTGAVGGHDFMWRYKQLLVQAGARHVKMTGVSATLARRGSQFHDNVYFFGIAPDGPIKIGVAVDVQKRLAGVQTGCPYKIEVIAAYPGSAKIERAIHAKFAEIRLNGEWFERTPELLEFIKNGW